jgi:hypothetical protein
MYKSQKTFLTTIAILIGLSASATFAETEQSLAGCLKSQNGQYVLKNASGKKDLPLLGARNFDSYVGHSIVVHGRFAANSNTAGPDTNSGVPGSNGSFIVTRLQMVAQTCTSDKTPPIEHAGAGKPSPYHK